MILIWMIQTIDVNKKNQRHLAVCNEAISLLKHLLTQSLDQDIEHESLNMNHVCKGSDRL